LLFILRDCLLLVFFFFFSSRRRHTRSDRDWSSDVCSSDLALKNLLQWDDALDVWGVHGVGGFLGIVMLGVLATKAFNPAGADGRSEERRVGKECRSRWWLEH